jgi:hypothetical protein
MIKVLDKICRENQNTHVLFNNFFFWKSNRLWDSVQKYGGDWGATNDVTIWRMRFECWVSKATYTNMNVDTQVILIAFPQQQLFANAPQCHVLRALSLLLTIILFKSSSPVSSVVADKILFGFLRFSFLSKWPYHRSRRDSINFTISAPL